MPKLASSSKTVGQMTPSGSVMASDCLHLLAHLNTMFHPRPLSRNEPYDLGIRITGGVE